MGTDRPEATMVFTGFFTEILAANPLNPLKLTLVQYQSDCYRVAILKPLLGLHVFIGFFTEILAANPFNQIKLTLVQYQSDCYRDAFLKP
jgi:predicted SnoaL-like aldol condensation-catalyzing enzyme